MEITLSLEQSQMLDKILNTFGDNYLDCETIIELFDNDEKRAWEYCCVLDKYDLIGFIGDVEGEYLPLAIERGPSVGLFLENGGFIGLFNKRLLKEESDMIQVKLQQENLLLQNRELKYKETIRELDEKLKRFEILKNYEWLIRLAIAVCSGIGIWLYIK